MDNENKNRALNRLTDLLFYFCIFIFIVALAFPHNPAGNWYQQFLPNIGGRTIQDIEFLDSLIGYASARQTGDTTYILKTTNSGDNWQIIYRNFFAMTQIQFLNVNTGYAVGAYLYKTTNGGFNWNQVTAPAISPEELYVIDENTIWIISSNSLTGGVFFTSTGGASWQQQINLGSQNPEKIYLYNQRIGFISKNMGSQGYVRKTTDGGATWALIVNNDYYLDMYFADSLIGWKSSAFGFKKTTNGGLNWITQTLPSGGIIQTNPGLSFSNVNKDTIWSSGGYVLYPNNTAHGFLNRTTNGGDTWYFQIPDTSLNPVSGTVIFVNKFYGWSYANIVGGIHTTNGGDTTFYLPVHQTSSEVPKEYMLEQNYPNPFNPTTHFGFRVANFGLVKLTIYDITGKEITTILNEELKPGVYETEWNAANFSSGVYLYQLTIINEQSSKEVFRQTRKMVLIK